MRTVGHAYNLLSPQELDLIRRSALRILAEMGIEVQSQELPE
jgi:trimethylamine:corrinoid methyltransferase-like protein